METRERYVKQITVIDNKVQRWLSIYFPEFKTVFKDWTGKGAIIALKNFATPEKVKAKGVESIAAMWKAEIKRAVGTKHAIKLVKAAEVSVGIKEGIKSAEYDLLSLIEEYEFDIFGPMFEAMLQGEMESHLGYENNDHSAKSTSNRRNGYTNKTVKSTGGDISIEVPRDREGSFEPQIIPKRSRDVSGIEDMQ